MYPLVSSKPASTMEDEESEEEVWTEEAWESHMAYYASTGLDIVLEATAPHEPWEENEPFRSEVGLRHENLITAERKKPIEERREPEWLVIDALKQIVIDVREEFLLKIQKDKQTVAITDGDKDDGWKVAGNRRKLAKARLTNSDPSKTYAAVLKMQADHPSLKINAKANPRGGVTLAAQDETSAALLTQLSQGNKDLALLDPAERRLKWVVMHYPHEFSIAAVSKHPGVLSAARCRTRGGAETKSVLITTAGPLDGELDLGVWGRFKIRPFIGQPVRCFKCNDYGHRQDDCDQPLRCGVCAGQHDTEVCIAAHKSGQETSPKCPNCEGEHHAWHPRCPARPRATRKRKPRRRKPEKKAAEQAEPPAAETTTLTRPQLEEILYHQTDFICKLLGTTLEEKRIREATTFIIDQAMSPPDKRKHHRQRSAPRKKIDLPAPLNRQNCNPTPAETTPNPTPVKTTPKTTPPATPTGEENPRTEAEATIVTPSVAITTPEQPPPPKKQRQKIQDQPRRRRR